MKKYLSLLILSLLTQVSFAQENNNFFNQKHNSLFAVLTPIKKSITFEYYKPKKNTKKRFSPTHYSFNYAVDFVKYKEKESGVMIPKIRSTYLYYFGVGYTINQKKKTKFLTETIVNLIAGNQDYEEKYGVSTPHGSGYVSTDEYYNYIMLGSEIEKRFYFTRKLAYSLSVYFGLYLVQEIPPYDFGIKLGVHILTKNKKK